MLRFAGAGPMLLGAIVSVYELGGWPLLLGLPATIAAFASASNIVEGVWEDQFRDEVIHDLREGCPDIPEGAITALSATRARQYETNRLRLEVQWTADTTGAATWRIEVRGSRPNLSKPWLVTELRALTARVTERSPDTPPPQTRFWDSQAPQLQWETVWQRQ